jgi:REP element-mobilizing transposase RayT
MAKQKVILKPGSFYHIYNRGTNSCAIFRKTINYEYFLDLYDKYITSVADTYAWVLMGNHFHVLVRTNTNPQGFVNLEGLGAIEKRITQQFSNLFNAYTKAFNKMYGRTGSLFEHNFRRKQIDNKEHLKRVILYIHNNPVHHNICEHAMDYPWSSYLTCISVKPTKLNRETVVGWFDSEANFKTRHNDKIDIDEMNQWLGI